MKTLTSFLASFALAIALAGCGGGDHKDHKDDAHKDHKDDAHGDDHKDHGHKDDDHHHGPEHALGTLDIGGFKVAVNQMGDVKPGGEGDFHVKVTGGTGKVTALRAWVGAQDGKGSSKVTAKMEGEGSFDAEMDVPDPIPAGGKVWIELEVDGGKKAQGSIDFKK
jgi:hypothetical protein